jgi:hypothetical protein
MGLLLQATVVLVAAGTVAVLALALITKVLTGEERLAYYHHEIAVMASAALCLLLLEEPVLPYLDAIALATHAFLVFGRVGCFMVGCCHGVPAARGVRYRPDHAIEGFPPYLVDVRLVPVPLIESVWLVGTVAGGVVLVLGRAAPGAVLAWCTVVYGLGRFAFEFLRGDSARPYFGTFSEAQWTAFLLSAGTAACESTGLLPLTPWHPFVPIVVGAVMVIVMATGAEERRLLHARHLREIVRIIESAHGRSDRRGTVRIAQTTLGLWVSTSTLRRGAGDLELIAVSSSRDGLTPRTARRLGRNIARLRRRTFAASLVGGQGGVYHLLLPGTGHAL